MRRETIDLPNPDDVDRPGDSWMAVRATGSINGLSRRLTWTGRRRRYRLWFLALFSIVSIAAVLVAPESIFRPGPLSTPHAQILAGSLSSEKCGACHQQAALSVLSWFRGAGAAHENVLQSELCLNCHHRSIPQNLARTAHNLPLSVRNQLTHSLRLTSQSSGSNKVLTAGWIPDAAVDQNNIECATCHREHHGDRSEMLSLSDAQCQTCHQNRFGSFADEHPQWKKWPYGRSRSIAFDHSSHQTKHFPSWKSGARKFDCIVCHPDASAVGGQSSLRPTEPLRVANYATSCKHCHDEALNTMVAKGIDFVALPTLPSSALTDVPDWPEPVTGFADGVVPALTELLSRNDSAAAKMIRDLPGGDVSRGDANDIQYLQRLGLLAQVNRRLVVDFSQGGHAELEKRLTTIGISSETFREVLRSLPPQLVSAAGRRWFREPIAGTTDHVHQGRLFDDHALSVIRLATATFAIADEDDDDLLGPSSIDQSLLADPLADSSMDRAVDPLANDETPAISEPTADIASHRLPSSSLVMAGGWYIDDLTFAIRYRSTGHADPVIVGLIETFAQLGEGDPLKQRFFTDSAIASCVTCHPNSRDIPATWTADQTRDRRLDFTKFSHRPHLNISTIGDCVYCHRIRQNVVDKDQATLVGYQHTSLRNDSIRTDHTHSVMDDFERIEHQSCAACHNSRSASDHCITCHRYHIVR